MDKQLFSVALASFLLLATTVMPASAQSLRCSSNTIGIGEPRSGVLQKCGEPIARDSFCKPVDPQTVAASTPGTAVVLPCEKIDEWTYNPGYGQFITTLRLEAGKVTAVSYGDRVK
jgi:hypothetical protein